MKFFRNSFFHVFILCVPACFIAPQYSSAQILPAENQSADTDTVEAKSRDSIFITNTFTQFGLSAGTVLKDEYDPGFGFGAKLKRTILYPRLELRMSIYLWGASVDSLDVTSIGYEEALTFKKTFPSGTSFFSGIIAGYYLTNNRSETIVNSELHVSESRKGTFEAYLTYGINHPIKRNRAVFAQVKYGLTFDKPEIHIHLGMYFSK